MKPPFMLIAMLMLLAGSPARAFVNMNFESANVANGTPVGFLNWADAAPGWSHSSGADTSLAYYGTVHVGTTQWYLLADSTLSEGSLLGAPTEANEPLEGRFSMLLHSGYDSSFGPSPSWVQAYLAQTDLIPVGTQSVRLHATGSFSVLMNGTPITMFSLGGDEYIGDISGYAGTTAEFKFMDGRTSSSSPGYFSRVDSITFSSLATTPEPSRALLLACGMFATCLRRRR